MSLKCGLVGLPNVGKSSLFNCILKKSVAAAANYPFCTIEPNTGNVPVKDVRLDQLAAISKSEKTISAILTCMDIAGLVKGANKGEGLGNQFLGHIRTCDLIIHVVRCFDDKEVTHVEGSIDPVRDYEIINLELQFSDIEKLEKILTVQKKVPQDIKDMAQKAKEALEKGKMLHDLAWDEKFIQFFNDQGLLTHKPMLVAANMSSYADLKNMEKIAHLNPVPVYVSVELLGQEIQDEAERKEFIKELGVEDSNIDLLIQKAYAKLDLISFFTTGEKETRAWKVRKGDTMQDAAAVIHSDFYKSFIHAEVLKFEDFVEQGGWSRAREKGLIKICSKGEIVQDGNVCIFKTYV
jgi:GTP-binding protein YchF